MTVVYVPSPLSCYELEGEEVSVRSYLGRTSLQPARRVQERSREIRARVRALASAAQLGFVDPTDVLRSLARTTAIHGPGDWGHFNEKGYRCLSEEILAGVFATGRAPIENGDTR
jgi:lysophospholipase L1-like esterase